MTIDAFPSVRSNPAADPDTRTTPPTCLAWCRKVAGVEGFQLDVAASDAAHVCPNYYTTESNGLERPWLGNVWCNPPFSDLEPWVRKAWDEWAQPWGNSPRVIAMLLPANRCEQPFWQRWVEPYRDGRDRLGLSDLDARKGVLSVHFLPGRVEFGHVGNPKGTGQGAPFGCVLLVWR